MKEKKDRILAFEIMRIVAILLVIFNHSGTNGANLYMSMPVGSFQFYLYLFLFIFCKCAVPLFFMISGALMLEKNESIKEIWKKRILKMVIVLVLISLFYYFYKIGWNFSKFNCKTFLKLLYKADISTPLWFLYAYIGYLISLPFLRSLVKNLQKKHYYYMILLAIIINAIIPIIQCLVFKDNLSITNHFKLNWIVNYIILFPCIGYFLHTYFKDKNNIKGKQIIILWLINIVCILLTSFTIYYKIKMTKNFSYSSINTSMYAYFSLINAICIFLSVKYICNKHTFSSMAQKLIISMGSCTFGIYLIHSCFLYRAKFMIDFANFLFNTGLNKMILSYIRVLCVFLLSYIIILILKKIPLIKKIL